MKISAWRMERDAGAHASRPFFPEGMEEFVACMGSLAEPKFRFGGVQAALALQARCSRVGAHPVACATLPRPEARGD